jgi:hypothetical protein
VGAAAEEEVVAFVRTAAARRALSAEAAVIDRFYLS